MPAVLGDGRLSWAMPCVPLAGIQTGIYAVPTIGSHVWVEFEAGDPDYPIYAGGFWGRARRPHWRWPVYLLRPSIVLQTNGQNAIAISDMPGVGGILLKSASGATITINETGIIISNGQGAIISMTGPVTDINAGALTIT